MPASPHEAQPPRAVSMSTLLAAGAAANAVSTPPRAQPAPRPAEPEHAAKSGRAASPSRAAKSSPSGD